MQVAVWNHNKVYERTVWKMNTVMTNNLAFLPGGESASCCCSSSDGTVKVCCSSFYDCDKAHGRVGSAITLVHSSNAWSIQPQLE